MTPLEALLMDWALLITRRKGSVRTLVYRTVTYLEAMMATDREQEAQLGQSLNTLNAKVDALTAKVDSAATDLGALRTQVTDLVAQLEAARTDDVELSDEIALAESIGTKIDELDAKLTAPVPTPPTPEPPVEPAPTT